MPSFENSIITQIFNLKCFRQKKIGILLVYMYVPTVGTSLHPNLYQLILKTFDKILDK